MKSATKDIAGFIQTHILLKKRGEDIELTHREFELFHYLSKHMGQVMTREHLLQNSMGL